MFICEISIIIILICQKLELVGARTKKIQLPWPNALKNIILSNIGNAFVCWKHYFQSDHNHGVPVAITWFPLVTSYEPIGSVGLTFRSTLYKELKTLIKAIVGSGLLIPPPPPYFVKAPLPILATFPFFNFLPELPLPQPPNHLFFNFVFFPHQVNMP